MSEEAASSLGPVVGIGASAGGLEALEGFFSHLPRDTGAAFVVVTHQQPGRTSLLPEILRKQVSMPIVEATNGMVLQSNHIYLSPPGLFLALLNGVLQVMDVPKVGKPVMPIDYFFRSLALDQKNRAVGIVLSGTGTDGTLGMSAIQGEGGLTMAQLPGSAKYAGMPNSAIAMGRVDFVLPPEQMPSQLVAYLNGPLRSQGDRAPELEPPIAEALQSIFILLRDRTRHDFSPYKKTTLRRRIDRRMNVHHLSDYPHYVRYLQENPPELDALFKELLIGVTAFFRDHEAFACLTNTVLPELLRSKADDDTVRVWVPACSTGEEAYSIAISLLACREQLGRHFRVLIFATDLDSEAVEVARKATYPEGIANDVDAATLEKYFNHRDGTYQIKKDVREMVVFAVHNILSEPPFHGLDLISCRNLLIYLEGEAQERLVSIFNYALHPGGILFLGTSESLGSAEEIFTPLDKRWKIYKRIIDPTSRTLTRLFPGWMTRTEHGLRNLIGAGPRKGPTDVVALLNQLLLDRYVPPSAIVHESGEILAIHGRTGALLEPTPGKPAMNILTMARQGLRGELIVAIRQAMGQTDEVVRAGIRVKSNGNFSVIDLSVVTIQQPEVLRGMLLVTFHPVRGEEAVGPLPPALQLKAPLATSSREEELERELRETKAILQNTIERLETTNEELTSTNEELQSTNEEAQSVNEELETTKEEMQSLNEELETVNSELQIKVADLALANNDITNLLNATDIATLFLDTKFRITRFTPPTKRVINVIATDLGRPISDISSNLEYTGLLRDCQEVLSNLVPREAEVHTTTGSWFLMRISVYRTTENVIGGVVITFADISRLKSVQREKDLAESVLQTIRQPFLILHSDLSVLQANAAFLKMFRVSATEVIGRNLYDLGDGQWDTPQLRVPMEQILPADSSFEDLRVEHLFPHIGKRIMLLNGRRVDQPQGQPPLIFLAFQDITPGS